MSPRREKDEYQKQRGVYLERVPKKGEGGILGRASDISWKKRKISRDFQGQIRGKISRFRGIFAEKSQISKDFQRQILRKIGRFHGKFRGETSP